jgi:general secretion pathway protein E
VPRCPATLDALCEWLAQRAGLPFIRIDPLQIDFSQVADVMSASYAARFNILPVECTPTRWWWPLPIPMRWSGKRNSARSRRVAAPGHRQPARHRRVHHAVLQPGQADQEGQQASTATTWRCATIRTAGGTGQGNKQVDANDQHVINIVDWLWQYAFEQRASDIHLEPKRDGAAIRFRIDGVLHQVYQVPAVVMIAMTARIKLLGRMDVIEKRRPQDGRIKTRNARARKSSCACRPCPRPSAKNW